MKFYRNRAFYVFVMAFIAFILVMLITCSTPLIKTCYFLYTEEARGVRFGIWGWCLDEYGICSTPLQLGYTWEPQLSNTITKALVLYPISAVSITLTMISLIPVIYARNARADRIFVIFAWISFVLSTMAFTFMIAMWSIAKFRFEKRGFGASYGPLPWLSIVASVLLLGVALGPFIIGPIPQKVEVVVVQKRHRGLRRVKNFEQLKGDLKPLMPASRTYQPLRRSHMKNVPSS